MRLLLATTCLTPMALCAALPAAAQTVISGSRSTTVTTSTANNGAADDVIIAETGTIGHAAGPFTAVWIDSDNSVTNRGEISVPGGDDVFGIVMVGQTGNIVNDGVIKMIDVTPTDSDGDGDVDGPFANGTYRTGVQAAQSTGSVTNGVEGSIEIYGNRSYGIAASFLRGDVRNAGRIGIIGDNSFGVAAVAIEGSVDLGGRISAEGENSVAAYIQDVSGAVTLSGNISSTGYRYVVPPSDVSHLDADDLLQSSSTVQIFGNVGGGVKATGTITSYGSAAALQVGGTGGATALGPVAGGDGFGLVLGGTIAGNAVYQGVQGRGAVIQNASIAKGIRVDGTVSATAVNDRATALFISGTTAPLLEVHGTVLANGGGQAAALALWIRGGAVVEKIVNTGTIQTISKGGISEAIQDQTGSVRLIENTGLISATGGSAGTNAAIYLTSKTGSVVNQSNAGAGAAAPSIVGDIYFGAGVGPGSDALNLNAGSLSGNVFFGDGDNLLTVNGNAMMRGDAFFGSGNDSVLLTGHGSISGDLDFGSGQNLLALSDAATLSGKATFGSGDDVVMLRGTAAMQGDVAFGEGVNALDLADGAVLTGNATFGSSFDAINLAGASKMVGDVDFVGGSANLTLTGTSMLAGNVRNANGVNNLTLRDSATLLGNITLGTGPDSLALSGNSKITGTLNLGDGFNMVYLSEGAKFAGDATFGASDDLLTAHDNSAIVGNISMGGGANTLFLFEHSSMTGNASFGDNNDTLLLEDMTALRGDVSFGDGTNQLSLGTEATLIGNAIFGQDDDSAAVQQSASINGNLTFGDGNNRLAVLGTGKLVGSSTFGLGTDIVTLGGGASVTGNIDFGGGNDTLSMSGTSQLAGDVLFGDGDDRLAIIGSVQLAGRQSFGAGNDAMSLAGTSVYGGIADFAGGGNDMLTLADTARFVGTLANAQNLAVTVNGGTFAAGGTGTTAIGSLSVGAGGTLGVTINTAANAATRYQVTGNASFAPGSKLAVSVNGNITGEATYTVLHAGTITGAENLTATQLMLPFLLKSSIVTGSPANEIAIRVARKTAGDLGLNRSGASAYDAIFAALPGDAQMQSAVLALPDAASFKAAVASMLPDHAGGAFEAVTSGSRAMGRMLENADAPFADQGKWGYWINGVGFSRTKDIGDTASYDVKGWGTAGGAEVKTDAGNFGLSIGYLHGTDRVNGTRNSVTAKQYEAALYWRGAWSGLHPFARLSAARIDFDGVRHFNGIAGAQIVARTADTDWKGNLLSAMAGASYEARFGQLSLRPVLSIDYYRLSEDAHADTGGGNAFDLAVDKRRSDELAGNATLAAGLTFGTREDGWLRAELEGGRRQVLGGSLGATTARFVGGQAFTLVPEDRTSGWLGRFRVSGGAKALRLSAEFGREQQQGRAANAFRASAQLGF